MSKLHELLAVESNLENQANKVRSDLANTFEKKRHLFEEKRILFKPSVEDLQEQVESQSTLQSTVEQELAWVAPHIVKALDASYQVAEANTKARADVILEDDEETILLKNLPATALLELEKRVAEIHSLLNTAPTLDPAKGFSLDDSRPFVFKAKEHVKTRTRKTNRPIVLYDATKEHPAQTQLIQEDVPVGQIFEQEWSSMLTPARKSELINRAEILLRAVRKARSRANEVEIEKDKKIGNRLLQFILTGAK